MNVATTKQCLCPGCGRMLDVRSDAPPQLVCPNCRTAMWNPFRTTEFAAAEGGAPPGPVPPPLPLRVLPLDEQTSADQGRTTGLMVGLLVLLVVGAVATAATLSSDNGLFHLLILALIGGFVFVGAREHVRNRRARKRSADVAASATPEFTLGESRVLPYRNYYDVPAAPRVNAGAFVGGFFGAVGLCAAGFVLLLATMDYKPRGAHGLFLLIVVTAVVAFIVCTPFLARRPGWRGFGPGAACGLVLGLLALGPCAFCYTLTLG